MKKLPFFRFKTSLFAIVMLVAALFSCSKDRPELTSPNNPTAHISTQVLEQAKKGIKDPAVANFFDIGFAEQANANIVPVASGRSDEELINGLAYELLRLNENYNFVPTLISRAGYPYWSRADIYYAAGTGMASDTPVVLLPFAHLGSDSVEAVMLAMPLTDTAGWYTTIFTRKSVDSLIAVTANDVYGLGYKVLAFFRLDIALFQNPSQSHYNWLINAANGSNLVSVQDRCGLYQIGYCHEILLLYPHGLLPDGGVQNRDPGIDLCISFYIPCGTGASAGSSGVFCELNENFDWICDYMQTNPNPNGGGSGPNDGPNNTPPGDVGTRILNMHNNGEISEEDMNR
ncbi:MAG: hypothetical protein ACKVU2_03045, partial [Saprospiraceae bacterium]